MGHNISSEVIYTKVRIPAGLPPHGTTARVLALLDVPRCARDIRIALPSCTAAAISGSLFRLRRDKCVVTSRAPATAEAEKRVVMLSRTGKSCQLNEGSTRRSLYAYLHLPRTMEAVRTHMRGEPERTVRSAIKSLVARGVVVVTKHKEVTCS